MEPDTSRVHSEPLVLTIVLREEGWGVGEGVYRKRLYRHIAHPRILVAYPSPQRQKI